jgi:hypothetical protein
VDCVLDVIEEINLSDLGEEDQETLLDWQDELFDDLMPSRATHQEADRECFAADGAW